MNKVVGWLGGLVAWGRALASVKAKVTDDNSGWESWTRSGGGPADRPWYELQQEFGDVLESWRVNAWVRQVVRLTTAYVVGDGVSVSSTIPEVQTFVEDFVTHPENHVAQRLSAWCDELTRAGEIFPVLFTNRFDGMSQLRIIPASQIEQVITDPEDYEKELGYDEIVNGQMERRRWKSHRTARPGRVDRIGRRYRPDPMMLHYTINKPVGATRGESDITPLLPWVRRYVDWLKGRVMFNKIRNLLAIMWVQVKDAKQVSAKQKQYDANPPGEAGILVTGPEEDITFPSARIEAFQAESDGKALRLAMAAASNLSLVHFGEGDTANLSTSQSMDDRTYRHYRLRQQDFGFFLCDLAGWAYRRQKEMMGQKIDRKQDLQIVAEFSDISRSDNKDLADAAKSLVSGLAEMRATFPLETPEFDQLAVRLAFKFAGELLPEDEIIELLGNPGAKNSGDDDPKNNNGKGSQDSKELTGVATNGRDGRNGTGINSSS